LVTEQTAEINSARPSKCLHASPGADEEKPDNSAELKSEEMVGALVKLCKLIDSLLRIRAENAGTVDSKGVAKAKDDKTNADRDLLAIIKLSASIRKKSESLSGSQ